MDHGEVAGLLALMLLTDARRPARMDSAGDAVALAEQDRRLWRTDAIAEGTRILRTALARYRIGPLQLQAAIAALHLVQLAYREPDIATRRQQDHLLPLRDLANAPRPWDLGTCETPQLRKEVWSWLEAIVTWWNHEYVWDVADVIPPCWPQHPHLVHEIAVLADQRHNAGQALTSVALEEWHRYSLPSFTERMRTRLRNHCQEDHQSWPAKGRYTRHIAEASCRRRGDSYAADVRAVQPEPDHSQSPRLGLVDLDTGEINQL